MQAFIEVIFKIIFEVVFEIGLRLPGALICKCLLPHSDIAFASFRVILAGAIFWSIIIFAGWMIFG
jgi:hypothetical protein